MNPNTDQIFRDPRGVPYASDPTVVPHDVAPTPAGPPRVVRTSNHIVWDTLVIEVAKTTDHNTWIRLLEWPNYGERTYCGTKGRRYDVLGQALRDGWEPLSRTRESRGWPFTEIFEVWFLRRAVPVTNKFSRTATNLDVGVTSSQGLAGWVPSWAEEVE